MVKVTYGQLGEGAYRFMVDGVAVNSYITINWSVQHSVWPAVVVVQYDGLEYHGSEYMPDININTEVLSGIAREIERRINQYKQQS